MLAQSAGLSGKHTLPASWFSAWKKARWMKRLCGQICEPSTAGRGAALWIASLLDTPVSRFPVRVSDLANTIRGTFGLTSDESWCKLARRICFARTSLDTSLWGSIRSRRTYTDWATGLRLAWSARRTWRQAISANGCSSWPTARGEDGKSGAGGEFSKQVTQWKTPNVPSRGKESKESKEKRGAGGVDLKTQADTWPTPMHADDGHKVTKNSHQSGLIVASAHFPPILPAPATSTDGGASSKSTRRLNPRFVEWLMGMPISWTDIDGPGFGCAEMELWRMQRRSRLRHLLHSLIREK